MFWDQQCRGSAVFINNDSFLGYSSTELIICITFVEKMDLGGLIANCFFFWEMCSHSLKNRPNKTTAKSSPLI